MATVDGDVDLAGDNIWDDEELRDHWNETLEEYKTYHSIHASGKRLEEVLSQEELDELRKDYGDLVEHVEDEDVGIDSNNCADQENAKPVDETIGKTEKGRKMAQTAEPKASAPVQNGSPSAAMPQAVLGTVQDQSLQNLMMAWYYAGYYTGLHEGQHKPAQE